MEIKTTFLGTSNAIPTEKRNHPAILVSFANENILIDCGEGTQRQFRTAKINPCKLTRVLITHWHGDHYLGLPGLIETLAMNNYQKTLKIYGPTGTKEKMKQIEKLTGKDKIKLEVKEVKGKFINEEVFEVEAYTMKHGIPTFAYSIKSKDKLRLDKKKLKKLKLPNSPILKKLQQGKNIKHNNKTIKSKDLTYLVPGKKLAVIMDTLQNTNIDKAVKSSDLIISESTFSKEQAKEAKSHLHLTTEQAAKAAKKAKAKQLVLTHISQRYEHDLNKILKEAKSTFKNTILAKDLMQITI
tara:strand:+ start:260 stop:1153 length:894 start_codon:yes stop_codon:yes gene_type:complete